MKKNLFFKDSRNQEEYLKSGYTVVPLLDAVEISLLEKEFYKNFDIDELSSIYDTIATTEAEKIQHVNAIINKICSKKILQVVLNARVVASIFIFKKVNDFHNSLHLDPTMTTEEFTNLGVWIPLCNVDESVGRMCLLPNSHSFMPPYNAASMPSPYIDIEDELRKDIVCINMQAGEALFFNNSMLHCTEKNISRQNRIAVITKLIDENAPLSTVYYNPNEAKGKQVSLYQHNENVFLNAKFRQPNPPATSAFVKYISGLPMKFDYNTYNQKRQFQSA